MKDEAVAEVANRLLTPRQIETWRLAEMGWTVNRIAVVQGVSRSAVRGCLRRASQKLRAHGVKVNGQHWYVKGQDADSTQNEHDSHGGEHDVRSSG